MLFCRVCRNFWDLYQALRTNTIFRGQFRMWSYILVDLLFNQTIHLQGVCALLVLCATTAHDSEVLGSCAVELAIELLCTCVRVYHVIPLSLHKIVSAWAVIYTLVLLRISIIVNIFVTSNHCMRTSGYTDSIIFHCGWSSATLFSSHLFWHSLLAIRFPCVHLINNQILLIAWAASRLCTLYFCTWPMILQVIVKHGFLSYQRIQLSPSFIHFFIVVSDSFEIFANDLWGFIWHLLAYNLLYTPRFLCSEFILLICWGFSSISLAHRIKGTMCSPIHFLYSFVHDCWCEPLMYYL